MSNYSLEKNSTDLIESIKAQLIDSSRSQKLLRRETLVDLELKSKDPRTYDAHAKKTLEAYEQLWKKLKDLFQSYHTKRRRTTPSDPDLEEARTILRVLDSYFGLLETRETVATAEHKAVRGEDPVAEEVSTLTRELMHYLLPFSERNYREYGDVTSENQMGNLQEVYRHATGLRQQITEKLTGRRALERNLSTKLERLDNILSTMKLALNK